MKFSSLKYDTRVKKYCGQMKFSSLKYDTRVKSIVGK